MRIFTLLGLLLAASLSPAALSAQTPSPDCHCTIEKLGEQTVYSEGCFPADRSQKMCALTLKNGLGNIDLYHLEDLRGVVITVEKNVNARFEGSSLSSNGTVFRFPNGGTQIKIRNGDTHFDVSSENNGNGPNSVNFYNQQLAQCPGNCNLSNPSTAAVMPVTLQSWETTERHGGVELEWVTTKEEDNSHFVVSHSTDGRNFTALGSVTGRGSSDFSTDYYFRHLPNFNGTHYYRLEQFDFDGTRTELGVQSVDFSAAAESRLSVSPNPVVAGSELRIHLPAGDAPDVQLYGPAGRLVGTYALNRSAFHLPDVGPGVYTLRIGQRVTRIVVTP